MPAKDEASYIQQAIDSLRGADYKNWELIVIDDHSSDETFKIVADISKIDARVSVFLNKGKGKVQGLNYGYSLTDGEIIKCIDADDILDKQFFNVLKSNYDSQALYHDSYITTSNLKVIGTGRVNVTYLSLDFLYCLRYLKSLPRWAWSFTRDIGDKIFPMPDDLPFEDVWFSLVIKKHSKSIKYVPEQLYYYRQHDNQTYGGILNFSQEIVEFRANRILRLINVLEKDLENSLMRNVNEKDVFREVKDFNQSLATSSLTLFEILKKSVSSELKIKLILYKKLPFLTPMATRIKWLLKI